MAYGGVRLTAQFCWLAVFFAFVALWPAPARAQTDEIQVYNGELAPVGIFNLTWHNNYTPSGIKTPAFPGAIISDHSLNGVTEWALGVTPWFEAGLYLPLYSYDKNRGGTLNGWKLRTLFAVPDAEHRTFVYGVNFEFSFNSKHWDSSRFTSEIRPIIGWHLGQWDVIINPILDTAYDGVKNLDFIPSALRGHGLFGRTLRHRGRRGFRPDQRVRPPHAQIDSVARSQLSKRDRNCFFSVSYFENSWEVA